MDLMTFPLVPQTVARQPPAWSHLLERALDELDYGILLVDGEGHVRHMNQCARRGIEAEAVAVGLIGHRLRARWPDDVAPLHQALMAAADRGLRSLLPLGRGDSRSVVALVPLDSGVAALLLGRQAICERLSVEGFARGAGLTLAETRVLSALGQGQRPHAIAQEQGVKLSTVRTQIGAIRAKTGADSIADLLHMVAALPPMVGRVAH
jgi:DNA-binding CsgD family transcriptional regulator